MVHNRPVVTKWGPRYGAEREIHEAVRDVAVSMRAEDYLDMPERRVVKDYVDIPLGIYRRMASEMVVHVGGKRAVAANAGVRYNKLSQLANGLLFDDDRQVHLLHERKLEALAAMSGNLLVFTAYQPEVDRIVRYIPDARALDGGKAIDDWNAGRIRVAVAHPGSVGHGLNLQDGGSTVVWFGIPCNLGWYQQGVTRLLRQGQKSPVVTVRHIVARETNDEFVIDLLNRKGMTQEALLEAVKARIG